MARKRTRSIGEMISTACFAGMALKFALDATMWEGGIFGLIGLSLSSLACAAASIRFQLQSLADRIRNK